MSPPMVFIFRGCPPPHLMALARWGFVVVSLSRCPGVEHVADVRRYIEGRFVVIVGDRELAEELGVATLRWPRWRTSFDGSPRRCPLYTSRICSNP
mgnify:CR=1 FL=1